MQVLLRAGVRWVYVTRRALIHAKGGGAVVAKALTSEELFAYTANDNSITVLIINTKLH
jgi:hypothetical protein